MVLPVSNQFFHVLADSSEKDFLIFFIETGAQFFRDVPGIGQKHTSQITVQILELAAVIFVGRGEREGENLSFRIRGHVQFEAEVQPFSGVSPHCQSFHHSVLVCIFVEANRDVRGICQFDLVGTLAVEGTNSFDNEKGEGCEMVEVLGKGFVGTLGFCGFPESDLRSYPRDLLQNGQGDDFNDA